MYFYMAGVFRNEFLDNDSALGDASYSNLRVQYDYYSNQATCLVVLLFIGLVYKCLWLVSMRYHGVRTRRAVLQQVHSARRKARKLIKAGLRWSESAAQYQRAEHTTGSKDTSGAPTPGGSFAVGIAGDDDEAEVDFGNDFHIPQYS
jgi:heme exporter protein D